MTTHATPSAPSTSRRRLPHGLSLAAVVGVTLLTAACGASGGAYSGGGNAAGTSTHSAAATGKQVDVTETEFAITLPQTTFKPGTYTFVIKDAGHATHALEVDGPGVKDRSSAPVSGGQSTQLTVTLQKGSYRIYCPIANHAALGMDTRITVG